MLVLSRKEREQLIINDQILVTIVKVSGGTVRLGIEAPPTIPIRREELKTTDAASPSVGKRSA